MTTSKTAKKKATKKRDTRTVAQKNRALRQDELRRFLSEQKHVEKVIENINKIEDVTVKLSPSDVNRLKVACEQRQKLIGKYLPDLKSIELQGNPEKPIGMVAMGANLTDQEAKQVYSKFMQGDDE